MQKTEAWNSAWDSATKRCAENSGERQRSREIRAGTKGGHYLPFSICYRYPRNGKVYEKKLNAIIFCSVWLYRRFS